MKYKRGATLLELTIVIMLIAIMSVMVLSFTGTVSGWSNVGTDRVNLVQTENDIADALKSFLSRYDASNYSVAKGTVSVETEDEDGASAESVSANAIIISDSNSIEINKTVASFYFIKEIGYYVIDYTNASTGGTAGSQDPSFEIEDSESESSQGLCYKGSGTATKAEFIEDIFFTVEESTKTNSQGSGNAGTKRMVVARIFYYLPRTIGNGAKAEGTYITTYTLRSVYTGNE